MLWSLEHHAIVHYYIQGVVELIYRICVFLHLVETYHATKTYVRVYLGPRMILSPITLICSLLLEVNTWILKNYQKFVSRLNTDWGLRCIVYGFRVHRAVHGDFRSTFTMSFYNVYFGLFHLNNNGWKWCSVKRSVFGSRAVGSVHVNSWVGSPLMTSIHTRAHVYEWRLSKRNLPLEFTCF